MEGENVVGWSKIFVYEIWYQVIPYCTKKRGWSVGMDGKVGIDGAKIPVERKARVDSEDVPDPSWLASGQGIDAERVGSQPRHLPS